MKTPTNLKRTTEQEVKIYKNYRAALRSINAASHTYGSRDSKVSDRKNKARKLTVDRYNVSFQELKRIIAHFDSLNGIAHEHDVNYAQELVLQKAKSAQKENPQPCGRCQTTENVFAAWNPFEVNINDNYEVIIRCIDCYYSLEDDI